MSRESRYRCPECGGPHRRCQQVETTDAGMRWWIQRFGGTLPKGESPVAYVKSGSAPRELQSLLASFGPPRR